MRIRRLLKIFRHVALSNAAGVAFQGGWDTWFPGGNATSAHERLLRIGTRPSFVVGECELATVHARKYLQSTGVDLANFTFQSTGFLDHNSFWALRPDPLGARAALRRWVHTSLSL